MKKLLVIILALSAGVIMAQDFEYVGNSSCKMCHNKAASGAQYKIWSGTDHANTFETLKSENAAKFAVEAGIEGPAWEAAECLVCHTVGFGAGGYEVKDEAFWVPADDDRAGKKAVKRMAGLQTVGCEACHGPGSKYKSSKTMKAVFAGEVDPDSVGLLTVTEEICISCHNEKSPGFDGFNFEEMVAKIAHPYPEGMGQ